MLISKIPLRKTIPMMTSQRDVFVDMVVDRVIFKNNQITLSPCSTVKPTTGLGLSKAGVSFYWADFAKSHILTEFISGIIGRRGNQYNFFENETDEKFKYDIVCRSNSVSLRDNRD